MTNILIGFIIGFVFSIISMVLYGLWEDRDMARRIKDHFGGDFEWVVLPKSKIEKVREILDKEDEINK